MGTKYEKDNGTIQNGPCMKTKEVMVVTIGDIVGYNVDISHYFKKNEFKCGYVVN